jgi:hypothetical protein
LLKNRNALKNTTMAAINSRKALTPILATLLIIVIAVAAIAVTYSWVSSAVENTAEQAGVFLYMANVAFTPKGITVDIGNSGTSNAKIFAIYVGPTQSSMESVPIEPVQVATGQIVSLNLSYVWTEGITYHFKVTSTSGQSAVTFQVKEAQDTILNPTSSATVEPTPTGEVSPSPTPTQTPFGERTPVVTTKPTKSPTLTPVHTPGETVTIKFAISGASTVNGGETVITIDGVSYAYSDLNWRSWKWQAWTTHTISTVASITGYDSNIFNFSTWTNGNDLTEAEGTFTTPEEDVTVTANYALTTFRVSFAATGLTNFGEAIFRIDGVEYRYSDLGSFNLDAKKSLWIAGSTHSIEALTPVTNYDTPAKAFMFVNWTNGNGLVDASGTFTMPNETVTVTANYMKATVHVSFAQTGLSHIDSGVTIITIDGQDYDIWQIPNTSFEWTIGSTHTVVAQNQVKGWDNVNHHFISWTNGNGLTDKSGILTVPDTDAVVTVNYTPS